LLHIERGFTGASVAGEITAAVDAHLRDPVWLDRQADRIPVGVRVCRHEIGQGGDTDRHAFALDALRIQWVDAIEVGDVAGGIAARNARGGAVTGRQNDCRRDAIGVGAQGLSFGVMRHKLCSLGIQTRNIQHDVLQQAWHFRCAFRPLEAAALFILVVAQRGREGLRELRCRTGGLDDEIVVIHFVDLDSQTLQIMRYALDLAI
jgi:hypothetical protein